MRQSLFTLSRTHTACTTNLSYLSGVQSLKANISGLGCSQRSDGESTPRQAWPSQLCSNNNTVSLGTPVAGSHEKRSHSSQVVSSSTMASVGAGSAYNLRIQVSSFKTCPLSQHKESCIQSLPNVLNGHTEVFLKTLLNHSQALLLHGIRDDWRQDVDVSHSRLHQAVCLALTCNLCHLTFCPTHRSMAACPAGFVPPSMMRGNGCNQPEDMEHPHSHPPPSRLRPLRLAQICMTQALTPLQLA